jgi:putative DNA primase/helicase
MMCVSEVKNCFQDARIECDFKTVRLPHGTIPVSPKIAQRESRLDILLTQAYQSERQLFQDIYAYDPSLRPEDFCQPLSEKNKTTAQIEVERAFYQKWMAIQKMKDEIDKLQKELSHMETDSSDKILDHADPLLIADAILSQFCFQGDRTLQYCVDAFWSWTSTHYCELNEGEVRQIVYRYLRDAKKMNDQGFVEDFKPNKHKVDQIIDALRAICYQKYLPSNGPCWLDGRAVPDPKYLIPFCNGLLDLAHWLENPYSELIPHTPKLMSVNVLPFAFESSNTQPKEWLNFLNALWPDDVESQQLLQEWMGLLLTQNTSFHKILLMIGPPRSGKGTIGRILRAMLGHENVVGPTFSSLGGEFGMQPLLNKTLAVIADARVGGKGGNIIVERLLSISGEDPLTVNRKFLVSLTAQLPTRIMIMSNEMPDLRDSSGALAKRYLVLILKHSWYGKEDIELFNKLHSELPCILLWALQGLRHLYKRRCFIQPQSSVEIIADLRAMTSPVNAFLEEKCILNPEASIQIRALYHAWQEWCAETRYAHAGNAQTFGKNLKACCPEIKIRRPQSDSDRQRYYEGIELC